MKRRALPAVLLMVAVAGGCTRHEKEAPTSSALATSSPVASAGTVAGPVIYAFEDTDPPTGAHSVFLVRNGRIFAGMPGSFPAFTGSGKYLLTSTSEKIFAMDVATGERYEHRPSFKPPFECPLSQSLVDDSVMLVGPGLERLMLPGFTAGESVPATLPPRRPGCVVGSVHGDPLVLVNNQHGRQLYRVGADGATRRIGPDPMAPPDLTEGPQNIEFSITKAPRMSYSLYGQVGGSVMHVLDLDSGLETVPATRAFWRDSWWSSTGLLHATKSNSSTVAGDQLWRVVDGAWELVNQNGWHCVRELPGGGRLILGRPRGDGSGRARPDALYEEGPDGVRLIARNAGVIVTPPVPVRTPPSLTEPFRAS